MSKKHFIALADVIRDSNRRYESGTATAPLFTEAHICELADFCKSQNGNFNRERWLGYIAGTCGKNGGAK
jgi:hypothetical protein